MQACGEQVRGFLAGVGAGADGQRVGHVHLGRLYVLGEVGDAVFQARDGLWQLAQAAPGFELLIGLLSRNRKSSEQFMCFNRRYHEMQAE